VDSFGASAAGTAMDEISFIGVKLGELLLEVGLVEVDVYGVWEVLFLVFFRCADVENLDGISCIFG